MFVNHLTECLLTSKHSAWCLLAHARHCFNNRVGDWDVTVRNFSRCCLFCSYRHRQRTPCCLPDTNSGLCAGWDHYIFFLLISPTTGSCNSSIDKPWAANRWTLTEMSQTLKNIIGLSSSFCRNSLVHTRGFSLVYVHIWRWGSTSYVCVRDTVGRWGKRY